MRVFKRLISVALLLISISSYAQEEGESFDQGFRLGFGLNGGVTTGDYFNMALGADARLQYDLTSDTSFTFTTGYTQLFGDDNIDDLGFIPVKVGFKAFLWNNAFYVMGEAGAGFAVTNDYDLTSFLWAPSAGYTSGNYDLSLRFEGMSDFEANQITLRLAYGFKL